MSLALVRSQRRLFVLASHLRGMSSAELTDVEFLRKGCVGHAKLNRPKALNSLNVSMLGKLQDQFKSWESDDQVSLYLMSGNGGRAFCAGGDVRSLAKLAADGDKKGISEFFQVEFAVDHQLAMLQKPLVALVDNVWMGGGVGITINAPFRVATEKTVFAMPETAIGFFPDVGVTHFLSRMGNMGRFLALTGQSLRGHDVYLVGLATHFVPSEKMAALADDLESLTLEKDISNVLSQYHTEENLSDSSEPSYLTRHRKDLEAVFGGESVDAIMAYVEEHSGACPLANSPSAMLKSRCPQSLAVAWEQLRRNKDLSLHDVLVSDYRLALRLIPHSEFKEGIRAALVDKDKNPKWTSTLPTVDVDALFAPMTEGTGFKQGN